MSYTGRASNTISTHVFRNKLGPVVLAVGRGCCTLPLLEKPRMWSMQKKEPNGLRRMDQNLAARTSTQVGRLLWTSSPWPEPLGHNNWLRLCLGQHSGTEQKDRCGQMFSTTSSPSYPGSGVVLVWVWVRVADLVLVLAVVLDLLLFLVLNLILVQVKESLPALGVVLVEVLAMVLVLVLLEVSSW